MVSFYNNKEYEHLAILSIYIRCGLLDQYNNRNILTPKFSKHPALESLKILPNLMIEANQFFCDNIKNINYEAKITYTGG